MEQTVHEFFHDFRQELMAGAEANSAFQLAEFAEEFATELRETGFIEDFNFCHFRTSRGIRVDGFWFNDEGGLDLFIADFESRSELASLTQTEVNTLFKRLTKFFEESCQKRLFDEIEETSPEYGLSREIFDRRDLTQKVNFFIFSERILSDRLQSLESNRVCGIEANYSVWDISRLHRQRSSRSHKEALDIDLRSAFGTGLPCLPAHIGSDSYESYLIVVPGEILASLYEKYGSRLLEQNVRSFLQARGKVNKGIRTTILTEPGMFFAYNNGITATAQAVEVGRTNNGLEVTRLVDLQIVNGGQTTASLFHTRRKDKASLDSVFVQMKLSVIPDDMGEEIVPRISEYANTQNRVNAADFFSNHPFHIRMEEFSRRLWAPAQQGAQRETKWFYERARGQYADAQSKLTKAEQRRFKAEYPKPQMFTKTDLAKFQNVWEEHPKWVNLGAQKNFGRFAARIGKEWIKNSEAISELYYRKAIARAIIFRKTEKLVSAQPWYNGGYRANIVVYSIACLAELCKRREKSLDFEKIWLVQQVPEPLENALAIAAKFVNEDITNPPEGISNISEWSKKDGCWERLLRGIEDLADQIPSDFWRSLVSKDQVVSQEKTAKKVQKIDDGIAAQSKVCQIPAAKWAKVLAFGRERGLLTPKEAGVVSVACQIPVKLPSEKQSLILLDVIQKVSDEGLKL